MKNTMNNYPNSSFSSSLLEEIYRSFDNDDDNNNNNKMRDISQSKKAKMNNYSHNTKRTSISNAFYDDVMVSRDKHDQFSSRDEIDRYVLRQWMDNQKDKDKDKDKNFVKLRRNSMPEHGKFRRNLYSSSSTSSSDSSSGIGGFSSSDTDSFTGAPTRMKSKVSSLKPIRTATSSPDFGRKSYSDDNPAKKKSKKDGKLQHALKLYGELKKVKQPISPGGKLASFLNSLFNSGNSKKTKFEPVTSSSVVMTTSSVPSTASSYSRSCLSKTPSSAGRYERRSVRFCPVNVVVDETGQKLLYNDNNEISKTEVYGDVELKAKMLEKQKRVEEVAKELLKNYRNNNTNNNIDSIRKELKVNVIGNNHKFGYNGNNVDMRGFVDDDEDDDEESCCSSDLFELDNLLEVGVDDQELPVYETTHIRTNRAIANRSIF